MLMKIPEQVLNDKGITYIQKYPYGEMSRVPRIKNDTTKLQTVGKCPV